MKRQRINPTWLKWIRPRGEKVCSVRPLQATSENPQATVSTIKKEGGYTVEYSGAHKHTFFLTTEVEARRKAIVVVNEEHLYPKKPHNIFK